MTLSDINQPFQPPNSLYSANSKKSEKTVNHALLTPIRENSLNARNQSGKGIIRSTATSKLSTTGTARKSIKIIKPETIKRANNDAWMAAAIGDLEWLKNSLKISSEVVFDKNGFATLHLACIHGRLNIIKYLIEEQNLNINLPSSQGWCPIHLCINNNIGSKAVECLRYLISKGADINVKNNEGTYPLHIAASEGQSDCLKILLELKADTKLLDNRGQSALDLAKLWGHRNCAKYLNNEMWSDEKKTLSEMSYLERQQRCQQLLKQVKTAYDYYFEDKEIAEKNFEDWLILQVNVASDDSHVKEKRRVHQSLENFKSHSTNSYLRPSTDSVTPLARSNSNLIRTRTAWEEEPTKQSQSTIKRAKLKPLTSFRADIDWNYSIKTNKKSYVQNLNDFYPRDQYTCLPTDEDLLFLNKELKNQPMEKVKNLIKKDLSHVNQSENNTERQVVYRPKHVLDAKTRMKSHNSLDNAAALHLNPGDINSFAYKQTRRYFGENLRKESSPAYGSFRCNPSAVKKIKAQLIDDGPPRRVRDEKLNIVERHYGRELSNFMEDKRHGKMSQKYEKVFIC